MEAYEQELEVALEAARRASKIILSDYSAREAIPDARADITTDTDRASQEAILTYLHEVFPGDALLGEESTPTLESAAHTGARLWIVDPIDGTRGFAKQNGEFSAMIGFVAEGVIQVGVVIEPARDRVTHARRGAGCHVRVGSEESQCHVTATATLGEATLTQSHSKGEPMESPVVRQLGVRAVRESYSAGVKLAFVARGEVDLYVCTYPTMRDWDLCAGHILVEEAGGRVTGLKGETLTYGEPGGWQRAGIVATNGAVHAESLEKLRD